MVDLEDATQRSLNELDFEVVFVVGLGDFSEGDFVPEAFVAVEEADFGEEFDGHDGDGPFELARDDVADDEGVDGAGEPPGDGFDETAIMSFRHGEGGYGGEGGMSRGGRGLE